MCYWTAYVQLHSKFRKNSRDMQGFHGYSCQKNSMQSAVQVMLSTPMIGLSAEKRGRKGSWSRKNVVILQCNSQRVALQMNHISTKNGSTSPSVKNWGYLENWKSTAPVRANL